MFYKEGSDYISTRFRFTLGIAPEKLLVKVTANTATLLNPAFVVLTYHQHLTQMITLPLEKCYMYSAPLPPLT